MASARVRRIAERVFHSARNAAGADCHSPSGRVPWVRVASSGRPTTSAARYPTNQRIGKYRTAATRRNPSSDDATLQESAMARTSPSIARLTYADRGTRTSSRHVGHRNGLRASRHDQGILIEHTGHVSVRIDRYFLLRVNRRIWGTRETGSRSFPELSLYRISSLRSFILSPIDTRSPSNETATLFCCRSLSAGLT